MANASFEESPTINQAEVEKFNHLKSVWWDENGDVKLLHAIGAVMPSLFKDCLISTGLVKKELADTPTPLKGIQILEVGCGGGILSESLAKTGATVVGIDIVSGLIDIAKEHAALNSSHSNLTYILESVENYSKHNHEKYDAVVASEVIEHVDEQELFVNACAKCVKPGGSIFISTMNKTRLSWLGGIILLENILGIIPKGAHDWNKFISPEDVEKFLEKNNCKTKKVYGMLYNPFTNSWSWISNTSVFYALHAVKEAQN